MNLSASLFQTGWLWGMLFVSVAVLGWIWRTAPWARLKDSSQLNLLLGFAVGLTLVWSLKAGVKPGLNLHMLGAMAAALTFGPQLGMLVLGLALTGICLNGAVEWSAWPINFVLMAVVPVFVATRIHTLIERFLPAHFFIFIFVTGFLGAAITVIAQGAVACLTMVLAGAYTADFLLSEYLPFFLLLGFSEAWISGAVVTLLVIYRPGWVTTFDDRRYLNGK